MHSTSMPKFSPGYRQRDVNQVHPLVLESGKKNTGAMSIKNDNNRINPFAF